MKAILIAIVVIALMVFFGWLTFSAVGDRPSVSLNTEQVRQDTERAAEVTKHAADNVERKTKEAADELRHTKVNVDVDVDRKHKPGE